MEANKKNPAKPGRAVFACDPTYGPLVPTAAAFGLGRSTAFKFASEGKLETFTIGTRRYVYLDSLRTLPERLAANDAAGGDA